MSSSIFPLLRLIMARPARVLPVLLLAHATALPAHANQAGQDCPACNAHASAPIDPAGIGSAAAGELPEDAVGRAAFLAGKVSDRLGVFFPVLYVIHQFQAPVSGRWHGQWTGADAGLRHAGRIDAPGRDLVVGYGLTKNPSRAGPWNTAPAWIDYVSARLGLGLGLAGPGASLSVAQWEAPAPQQNIYALWHPQGPLASGGEWGLAMPNPVQDRAADAQYQYLLVLHH